TVRGTDTCGNFAEVTYKTGIDNATSVVVKRSINRCYQTLVLAEAAAIAATSATDNCLDPVNLTASTAGECAAVITVRGTDTCGNFAEVTYNTRIDNTAPVLVKSSINPCYQTLVLAEADGVSANVGTDVRLRAGKLSAG